MSNELPLIQQQWELLNKANTVISTHEQNITELEAMLTRERTDAEHIHMSLMERYSTKEQEVEQLAEKTRTLPKNRSLRGGMPQNIYPLKERSGEQIDFYVEIVSEKYSALEFSLRANLRANAEKLLFVLGATSLTVMFVMIYTLTTISPPPLTAGFFAANATATEANATVTAANATVNFSNATATAANATVAANTNSNIYPYSTADIARATMGAVDATATDVNATATIAYTNATAADTTDQSTLNAMPYAIGIAVSLILSILFFGCGLAIRHRLRNEQRFNYATILFSLSEAKTMIQELQTEANTNYDRRTEELMQEETTRRKQLQRTLISGFARLNKELVDYIQATGLSGADWQDNSWKLTMSSQQRIMPSVSQNILRYGKMTISYEQQRITPFPLFLPFPAGKGVLIQASRDSYEQAATLLQSLLLRLITTQLPGMVHFTFFDPLNFGQYVAPFMQLSTYDATLVGNRIWTESSHIEQQFTVISDYLAQVNQQYLWGTTPTIEEYNQQHPQNRLPYRMLVVQGFPYKFSVEATRTLLTIAHNGPRCGVYTLILCDMGQPELPDTALKELSPKMLTLRLEGQRIYWDGIQSELQAHSAVAL